MVGSSSNNLIADAVDCASFPIADSNYATWLAEKRKASQRDRTRRCRVRKAKLLSVQESRVVRNTDQDPKFTIAGPKQGNRTSVTLAREISLFAAKKMRNRDTKVHHLTIMKILGQPMLKQMVPPFLRDPAEVKLRHKILGSLKEGMQNHLLGLQKGKTVMAKNIVTTFAVVPGIGSGRGVARLLGVDRRNIKKALARRILLDTKQDAFWIQDDRRIRSDALPIAVRKMIIEWWDVETTVSPNRKDIGRKWIGPKQYIDHQTHHLQQSQVHKSVPSIPESHLSSLDSCGHKMFTGKFSWITDLCRYNSYRTWF